jgi:hypothetical protein
MESHRVKYVLHIYIYTTGRCRQRDFTYIYIYVRFDGALGSIPLVFDSTSMCLREQYTIPSMHDALSSLDAELEMQPRHGPRMMMQPSGVENDMMAPMTRVEYHPMLRMAGTKNGAVVHNDEDRYRCEPMEPFSRFTPLRTK